MAADTNAELARRTRARMRQVDRKGEVKRLRATSAELLAALEAAQEWFAANGRDHRAVNAAIAKTKGKLR